MGFRLGSAGLFRGVGRWRAARLGVAAAAFGLGAAGLIAGQGGAAAQGTARPEVVVASVDGTIDPVMARFVSRILDDAKGDGVELVIFRVDTPGGLLDSTRDITSDILASEVPVVSFVGPAGARAASAGTFIVASAGLAAMAPSTNIGAATPVGGSGQDLGETLERKATEDAAAYIRSIAEERGRDAFALERTVRTATSYSAMEALEKNVIDLIAHDVDDLLAQLDGMAVPAASGDVIVETEGARVRNRGLSVFERVLAFLSTPDIVFLFFSLGGLALIVELWSPGLVGPGVVGVILLLLSFAGLGQLPFHWTGVVLLILALVLIFAETQIPGFGVFGIGGVVSLVLGGLFLVGFFGTPGIDGDEVRVSRWLLVSVGGAMGLAVLWFGWELRQSRRVTAYVSPVMANALVGQSGRVTVALSPGGKVLVAGESWTAKLLGRQGAAIGERVVVRKVDGLTLEVELADEGEPARPA